jgi:uncharacterized protein (TIGR03790 family)
MLPQGYVRESKGVLMSRSHGLVFVLACAAALSVGAGAWALSPADVFILVNKNVPASREVADYYCTRRGVPKENVVALDLPAGEDISRRDYTSKLVAPLRAELKERRDKVKVLLCVYGVPLRVGRQEPSADEKEEYDNLRTPVEALQDLLRHAADEIACREHQHHEAPHLVPDDAVRQHREQVDAKRQELHILEQRRRHLSWAESEACVDSELSLLWWDDYELRRFLPNLLNWQVPDKRRDEKPPMLMTARLDGPSVALVKGLVDQALEVEKKGLEGKVYVDARKIAYDATKDPGYGYGGYDESLREMARLLEREAKLPVTLDDEPALFAPGSCPECALYCGWYSLANYVPCCRFVRGAVAYHIASSEAVSLRNPDSKYWCKCLLQDGVAATLGPVAEPYTIGFPKPAEFFGFLVTGEYTLVECYHRTALLTSWMTVLVGDPLYNPYNRNPKLAGERVKPSPAGGKFFLPLR